LRTPQQHGAAGYAMKTLSQSGAARPMTNSAPFEATLAHHDAAIQNLSGRITGVENGLKTLQGEVHSGFLTIQTTMSTQIGTLSSKLDKLDAAPKFDLRGTLGIVKDFAILFAMTVAGIIWIVNALNSGNITKSELLTAEETRAINELKDRVRSLEGFAWRPTVKKD
jgi:hypothetical protein